MRLHEIKAICRELEREGKPITFDSVSLTNRVSNITAAEWEATLAELVAEAEEQTGDSERVELHAESVIETAPPEAGCNEEEAYANVTQWENRLHEARTEYRAALLEQKANRGKLAEAIMGWQTGAEKYTDQQHIQDYLAGELELRRMRAAGFVPDRRPARAQRTDAVNGGMYQAKQPAMLDRFLTATGAPGSSRLTHGPRRGGMSLARAQSVQMATHGHPGQVAPHRKPPSRG